MKPIKHPLEKAFSSQTQETSIDNIEVVGDLPKWLQGRFINNGPAKFEIGQTAFNHWFDGSAMLKSFEFSDGKINFKNRFLESQQYVNSKKLNKLSHDEFGTYANGSWLKEIALRIIGAKKSTVYDKYDNCNVNTAYLAGQYVALTEVSDILSFDLQDLSTGQPLVFEDNIKGQMSLAHPHVDIETGESISINIDIGKAYHYQIYRIKSGSQKRELIKNYISTDLFYMHSFSVTPQYVILFKTPLVLKVLKLMLGVRLSSCFAWDKSQSAYFVIINRQSGEVTEIEAAPFVCLHSINSFEKGNEIILDLVCYDKGNPYDDFYMSNLRAEKPTFACANPKRYVLNLQTKTSRHEAITHDNVEFPRIHYDKHNGLDYQYTYMTQMTDSKQWYLNALQKLDVRSGNVKIWTKEGYYPGEPVFVANPRSQAEDDGVLMSLAYNANDQTSSLLIIDAQSMQQRAEVKLSFHLPVGLHSNFY